MRHSLCAGYHADPTNLFGAPAPAAIEALAVSTSPGW
jgi:hypothetical protein